PEINDAAGICESGAGELPDFGAHLFRDRTRGELLIVGWRVMVERLSGAVEEGHHRMRIAEDSIGDCQLAICANGIFISDGRFVRCDGRTAAIGYYPSIVLRMLVARCYSRSAATGSTRVARSAGMAAASNPVARTTTMARMYVGKSVGRISNN